MINEHELQTRINQWIEENEAAMIQDAIALTKIKSVSEPGEGGYPYGTGCAKVLDLALTLCGNMGFEVDNQEYYSGTALLKGETDQQFGVFGHLDVVPEGDLANWDFDPYESVCKNGYVLGRGSSDNKCPAVASLYTLKCIRDLGLPMKHSILLYLGCDEERGMSDIVHYWKNHEAPEFSFTSDGRYSLCYGEKGILTADLTVDLSRSNLIDFSGGDASNMVPDYAFATIKGVTAEQIVAAVPAECTVSEERDLVKIEVRGISAHAAFPEGSISAIHKLASILAGTGILDGKAEAVMKFLSYGFEGYDGTGLGIASEDDISGRTTAVGGKVRLIDGRLVQSLNVRYAIKVNQEEILRNLHQACERHGFRIENLDNNQPLYISPDHPAVQCLHHTANEFLDGTYEPYVMGGGTYARKIPNAVAYGPTTRKIDATDELKYGEGHQPNEGMKVSDMTTGVRIYVNALLRLDQILQ